MWRVDAIESGQHKYALQVCNKTLKKAKSPGDIAQLTAYKALALLSLDNGKDDEAAALVDQVRKTIPVNQKLIATLVQAMDMLGKGSDAITLYEEASKKHPKDEEFGKHWFEQMILRSDIDGARKAAMVLNKLPNQRKYFYWVLTTWKAHNANPQIRTLSVSMIARLVSHALSTLHLLPETISEVLLLLSAAPAEAALKFLQGDGKKWTSDVEVRRTYIDLLHDAERFSDLRDFCEDEIEQDVDDWKVVKGWIDGHMGVFLSDSSQSDQIQRLISKLNEKYAQRNFALGMIYLSASWSSDLTCEGVCSLREECVRYFTQYHRKTACFRDIQLYVAGLSKDQQLVFIQEIGSMSNNEEMSFNKLHREINFLKFDYMLRTWSVENKDDLVRCWNLYIEGTELSGPAEDTDILPGDDALLLGCYTLIKAYNKTRITKYLLQAALCLEAGLTKSNHNFQFKLLLVRIYLLLGAIPLANSIYSGLQIKQIQHETLSHVLLSRISTLYTDLTISHQLAVSRHIYTSNEDETPPQILLAFTEGTYHNVPDFWDLWMKLRHSLTGAILDRERELVALANHEDPALLEVSEELWDQRDLTVMTDCELLGDPSPEDFSRIGPLQGATTTRILAYGANMLQILQRHKSSVAPMDNMDGFRLLRSSEEVWDEFRRESTSAEFTTMELIWDIYECQCDIIQGKMEKLESLVNKLSERISFDGLEANDVTWEVLHATLLTACQALNCLASTCCSMKDKNLQSAATKIMEALKTALTACLDKLEVKLSTCTARSSDDTLERLVDSICDKDGYMQPMTELLHGASTNTLKKVAEAQKKAIQKSRASVQTELGITMKLRDGS